MGKIPLDCSPLLSGEISPINVPSLSLKVSP